MQSENIILTLLITGQCSQTEKVDPDEAVTQAIKLFSIAAQKTPQSFLNTIEKTIEVKIDGMVMIALAVLVSKANDSFLQKDNTSSSFITFLSVYGPPKILEFVEYLKSKHFGRGFGSRPQKWVRAVMESWPLTILQKFSINHHKEFYSLIMLVHPRYHGKRGKYVRNFLDN